MSRIYRDGQLKDCHIYRLLTTASIEEQIFRRQIVKKLMAGAVLNENDADNGIFNFADIPLHQIELERLPIPYVDEMNDEARIKELCVKITSEDLKTCLTHVDLRCNRCDVEERIELSQPSETSEVMKHEDALELRLWNHHFCRESLPSECEMLHDSWVCDDISFVFHKKNEKDENEEIVQNADDEDWLDDDE